MEIGSLRSPGPVPVWVKPAVESDLKKPDRFLFPFGEAARLTVLRCRCRCNRPIGVGAV